MKVFFFLEYGSDLHGNSFHFHRTLENELEKLRIGADNLSACEVAQKDVEWRPGDVVGDGWANEGEISILVGYDGVYQWC